MSRTLVASQCPVCDHGVAAPFHDGGRQPASVVARPDTAENARALDRHRLDFVQCPACWHVYNRAFERRAALATAAAGCPTTFASGPAWDAHVAYMRGHVIAHLPESPTVVMIGADPDGFLERIAAERPGRHVAFDPHGVATPGHAVERRARAFEPLVDLPALAPDLVILRHVLDREPRPAALIDQLAWAAASLEKRVWLFVEVPCVDRVLETDRLVDFRVEQYSHFTTESFSSLMRRAGRPESLDTGYDGEVAFAIVRLDVPSERRVAADASAQFEARSVRHRATISTQLRALAGTGGRIAIWGSGGRAASFIHCYGADARAFPLVVDPDPSMAGTFVPGAGQEIVSPSTLARAPVDVIIVTEPWRARDVASAVWREGIVAKQLLIEHAGRLVDYHRDAHPYRAPVTAAA